MKENPATLKKYAFDVSGLSETEFWERMKKSKQCVSRGEYEDADVFFDRLFKEKRFAWNTTKS